MGVPVADLAPNAPGEYTVKPHDTLWAISGQYLTSPWRWPELWGMNMGEIRNPHLIYPGQVLYLIQKDGRAMLSTVAPGTPTAPDPMAGLPVSKLGPRVRSTELPDGAIPTLQAHLLEPFLVEPVVVDELTLKSTPRLVAFQEGRVMASKGDRAYARSSGGVRLDLPTSGKVMFRVFRNAKPLKVPGSDEVLGYEAQYLGRAQLIRPESQSLALDASVGSKAEIVPATVDILASKEELRVGDRLLPEAPFELRNYTPKAPARAVTARVVSIYGSAFVNAAQNQVLAISRGARDGLVRGDVLAVLSNGERVVDKTDEARNQMRLPNERKGLAMVFRVFEKVAYVLVLDTVTAVQVGDYLVNPR
jgi:LysM repeat protein